jgi:thiol-disulfide isomerase/thioredoxin
MGWEDKYKTLEDYYTNTYGGTFRALDRDTLGPIGEEALPFFTLDPEELTINPDETDAEIEQYINDPARLRSEIAKCISSFPYFCHKYVKIMHPIRGLVPFVLYNYQRRVIEQYDQHRFNIISKFRQGGLTTVTAIWGLWRCMFKKDQMIMVMSKTDREAMTSAGMISRAIQWLPTWLQPQMAKDNEHVKEFAATNSKIEFQGPEAARSKSLTYMILDEAAFIDCMDKHWKAMYPTLSAGGNCVAISTVNGVGNWYYDTWMDAQAKKNKFHIIELDFWEHPDYNDKEWVADQKAQLGKKGWDQEVMRSFLGSGETYIPSDIIVKIENAIKKKGPPVEVKFPEWCNDREEFIEEEGALWVWEWPKDGHDYTMAVDCADGGGEDSDNLCFEVIDNQTLEQVAEFYSNKITPHIFAQYVQTTGIFYNTAQIVVENMHSSGGSVISTLQNELQYENLYFDSKKRTQVGIKTSPQIRPMVLQTLQSRVLANKVKINSLRLVHELKTFKFNASKKRPEAEKGKHDDAVMSMAIALYVRDQLLRDIPIGADVPKELLDTFKTEVFDEIKRELKEGAPEDFIEEDEDIFENYGADVMPGVVFNVRRKNDRLLREFGW